MKNMERHELKLDSDQGREIIYGDHEDFETIEKQIVSTGRWSIHSRIVVKRISDGLFFESSYSEGATEQQDEAPYEYGDAVFKQVLPLRKTITYYE